MKTFFHLLLFPFEVIPMMMMLLNVARCFYSDSPREEPRGYLVS